MNIGKTTLPITWDEIISKYGEDYILGLYIPNIKKIPCLIQNPYRIDKKPSFGITFYKGKIVFKDFATGEHGGLLTLLKRITGKDKKGIVKELITNKLSNIIITKKQTCRKESHKVILKIRKKLLDNNDISYWNSYGIDAKVLNLYGIYPIDYYWVNEHMFKADKLAYAYRVVINDNVYYKIYQPYSKYKWCNNYPKDTISLENYISKSDNPIIICSSVKDALCLKQNISGLDVCSLQGEGYKIPEWFLEKYKNRKLFILFDNDEAGINYSKTLSLETKIPYIEIPEFDGGKDISDYIKCYGKDKFQTTFNQLICQCF